MIDIAGQSAYFYYVTTKAKLFRVVLFVSIALNIAAAGYFGKKIYSRFQSSSSAPVPAKPAYYLERNKLFEALPKDSNSIIFLGNSLTQYFELAEILDHPSIRNRGIHGDMITGVLQRLSPIIASQPKKIFIEIGINDLEQKVPKDQLIKDYQRLIDTLKTSCTVATIYVQSLLPVADSSQRLPGYCSPEMNELIVSVNQELKQLSENEGCTFIDVHSHLLKAKELNPVYSVDGVHLSGEGYLQWGKVLKPYVEE
jgi:lysophospholipase L1-like esterase